MTHVRPETPRAPLVCLRVCSSFRASFCMLCLCVGVGVGVGGVDLGPGVEV